MGNKLLDIIDKFIDETNASWDHQAWLLLLERVRSEGINLPEDQLGFVLESEREKLNVKKQGLKIIPRKKLLSYAKKFIRSTNGKYSDAQRHEFLNKLSREGYYNIKELDLFISKETQKFNKKISTKQEHESTKTKILQEKDEAINALSNLQKSVLDKEDQIMQLNAIIESLQNSIKQHQTEFAQQKNMYNDILKTWQAKDSELQNLDRRLRDEQKIIEKNQLDFFNREKELAEKEKMFAQQLKGQKISQKKLSMLETYKKEHVKSKKLVNLYQKKSTLMSKLLNVKINELEKIKAQNELTLKKYREEKKMLDDAEKRLKLIGKDILEKKIDLHKREEWIRINEKPLKKLAQDLDLTKNVLSQKDIDLKAKEQQIKSMHLDLDRARQNLQEKETVVHKKIQLLSSEKNDNDKLHKEIAFLKKENFRLRSTVDKKLKEYESAKKLALQKVEEINKKQHFVEKAKILLEKKLADVNNREKQIIDSEAKMQSVQKELTKLAESLKLHESDLAKKEIELKGLIDENKKAKTIFDQKQKEYLIETKAMKTLKKAMQSQLAGFSRREKAIESTEKEMDDFQKELNFIKKQLDEERIDTAKREKELQNHQQIFDHRINEILKQIAENEELLLELHDKERQIEKSEETIKRIEISLLEREKMLALAKKEFDTRNLELQEKEETIAEELQKLDLEKQQLKKSKDEIDKNKELIDTRYKEIETSKADIRAREVLLEERKKEIDSSISFASEHTGENKTILKEIRAKEKAVEKRESELEMKEMEIMKALKELENKKEQVRPDSQHLDKKRQQLDEYEVMLKQKEKELKDKETNLAERERKFKITERLEKDKQEVDKEVKTLQNLEGKFETEVQTEEEKLRFEREALSQLKEDLDRRKKLMDRREMELELRSATIVKDLGIIESEKAKLGKSHLPEVEKELKTLGKKKKIEVTKSPPDTPPPTETDDDKGRVFYV